MVADSPFEYRNPTRIVSGLGAVDGIGGLARGRVLLVTTRGATERGTTGRVAALIGVGRVLIYDRVAPNPTLDDLDAAIDRLHDERVETVVAVGGGSAIDTGKVLALALGSGGVGARELAEPTRPASGHARLGLVAVPTTAGTGSEVTPFATVWDAVDRCKLSVATPELFPDVALVDATLTLGLVWEQTLSSGLDAYVQCIEAICNRNANTVTSAFAERGLALAPEALGRLRAEPDSVGARSELAEAALLSGLAISHTRTALAHSMSYPLTAHFGIPHGLACALVLPAVLEFNLEADDGRLAGVARRAGLEGPGALLDSVVDLVRDLDVAGAVSRYLPDIEAMEGLAPEMLSPSRADNNLRPAAEADVRAILGRTGDLVGAGRP
jgi:alcohol dehydrogenase